MQECKRIGENSVYFGYDYPPPCPKIKPLIAQEYHIFSFQNRRILLPNEIPFRPNPMPSNRSDKHFIIGATGYTDLEFLDIKYGEGVGLLWEQLVSMLVEVSIKAVRQKGRIPFLIHGAVYSGIHKILIDVASRNDVETVGFSSLPFITGVTDEDTFPVLCFGSQDECSSHFTESLNLLLFFNGKENALKKDGANILSTNSDARLLPLDVLGSVFKGKISGLNEVGLVEDALRVLLDKISLNKVFKNGILNRESDYLFRMVRETIENLIGL